MPAAISELFAGSFSWGFEGLTGRLLFSCAVFIYLLIAATVVWRSPTLGRAKMGRAFYIFTFHLGAFALTYAIGLTTTTSSWFRVVDHARELLGVVCVVNISGVLFFGMLLPRLKVTVAEIVADITMGAAYTLAFVFTLRNAGLELSGLIATSAVVTAVLGLSLQTTLGNILGGLALQADDSVRVGDWVRLEDGREGLVRAVHWRHTVVETRNWDTIIVPNAYLVASTVTILGRRDGQPVQHRMWVHFNVDFRFSPAEVVRVVEEAMQGTRIPHVAASPAPNCICFDFTHPQNDSVARYAVRYWLTDLAHDDPTSSAIRLRIFAALQRANIPLAIPGTAVFVSKRDEASQQRKHATEMNRRIAALNKIDIFDPMTPEEKELLAPRIRHAIFAPGEVITREGASAHWFYVLTQGSCQVRRAAGANERVVATLRAPGFFGEMGVMTGAKRDASVVALSEVECFRIDKEDFHGILKMRPAIADEISKILASREPLDDANDAASLLARSETDGVEQRRILGNIRNFFGLD